MVTRNMPPTVGGIERLMHRLGEGLCARYECVFIAPRGSRTSLPGAMRVYELPHNPAVLFVLLGALLAPFLLLRHRCRAVLAGNGLMTLATAIPAQLLRVPLVTMVYGLDIVASNRLYRGLALPLIRASRAVIACSRNTARLATERGVPADHICVITPGVDCPPDGLIPATDPVPGGPVLLAVGRLVRRKGVADFIRHALPAVLARFPDALLVVIGAAPEHALRREPSELERVQRAIRDVNAQSSVRLLGRVSDEELQHWMARARLHVFPVQDLPDDVEGFGLVALEAAASGVPTVAFDAGGVRDALEPGVTGVLVKPGDHEAFAAAACALIEQDASVLAAACMAYAARHSWASYTNAVAAVIDAAIEKANPASREAR